MFVSHMCFSQVAPRHFVGTACFANISENSPGICNSVSHVMPLLLQFCVVVV
jgi:hypothetical protein